jgi:hypothetical protein
MRGLHKNLINMGDAFQIFYDMGQHRSLPDLIKRLEKTHPEQVPSLSTLKKWHKEDEWKLQCMMQDKEIRDGVKEIMMPDWIKTKAKMLKVLLNQIDKSVDDGISPANTRDVVALVHEVRGIMGENDNIDVSGSVDVVSIYIPDNNRDNDTV